MKVLGQFNIVKNVAYVPQEREVERKKKDMQRKFGSMPDLEEAEE